MKMSSENLSLVVKMNCYNSDATKYFVISFKHAAAGLIEARRVSEVGQLSDRLMSAQCREALNKKNLFDCQFNYDCTSSK